MIRLLLILLVVCPIIWLSGDFIYSCWVQYQHDRWEERQVRDTDGVREGCREFTVGQGEPALLMIHGFADSPAIFAKMAEALALRGYTCRAIRLPDSSIPRAQAAFVTMEDQERVIMEELASLRREHQEVWLVAHSLGGALAADVAIRHPDNVDGLVLLAPLLNVSKRRSPLLTPRAWHRFSERTLVFTHMAMNFFSLDVRDPHQRGFEAHDSYMPRALYGELFRVIDLVSPWAGALSVPLLMVLSKEDRVTDPQAAEQFFHDAGSQRKKLRMLSQSGHVVPLDYEWENVVKDMDVFIRAEYVKE